VLTQRANHVHILAGLILIGLRAPVVRGIETETRIETETSSFWGRS
jgi:hypothetical protein